MAQRRDAISSIACAVGIGASPSGSGSVAAAAILLAAICSEQDVRRRERSWRTGVALAIALFVTSLAAHFGGLLMHGGDFFAF